MSPEADAHRAIRDGVFTPAQARRAGFSRAEVRSRLRLGSWVRLRWGVLARADRNARGADDLVAVTLALGPGSALAGDTAARMFGWDLRHKEKGLIAISPFGRRAEGVLVRRRDLGEDKIVFVGRVPVTSPAYTVLDLSLDLSPKDAVIAADSALRAGGVAMPDLRDELGERRCWARRAEMADVLDLADPLAGSVAETEGRLLFLQAGLPPPVTQFEVSLPGFLARVDFCWPDAALIVEVDGYGFHADTESFRRDRYRQNALVLAGYTVLRFAATDIRFRPDYVTRELLAAYRRS